MIGSSNAAHSIGDMWPDRYLFIGIMGKALVGDRGNRIGVSVYTVFSLQSLRNDNQEILDLYDDQENDLVLMTEDFWKELGACFKANSKTLGYFQLKKGPSEKVRIFRYVTGPKDYNT